MARSRYFMAIVAFAIATLLGAIMPAQAKESTTERNRQFIAQAYEKWAAGGKTFFQDVLAPDVIWTIKGSGPSAGVYRGRDDLMKRAVAPFAARMSTPMHPTVQDIWAQGNDVVVHWDGVATATDGAIYRNSYVWIFRIKDLRAVEVVAFLDLVPFDDLFQRISIDQGEKTMSSNPYVGMWVTDNGHIRHELLADNRYDEARGTRQSAYQGRYELVGNQINYWDDTGFTADGVFVDQNTLHHGGMIFRRR